MKTVKKLNNHCAIVYDGDRIQEPFEDMFDPAWWLESGKVTGEAPGRGSALFIDAPFGQAVLRRYLRGGWPAKFSHDRYFFTGVEQSRPFREFRLLADMHDRDLPVPQPLAAACRRRALSYRGVLLTRRIMDTVTMDELLTEADPSAPAWAIVGRCLARFHRSGVSHADLNVRNILLHRRTADVFLVDFDRASFTPGRAVDGRANLARLQRSLHKLWPSERLADIDACWQALLDAYHG